MGDVESTLTKGMWEDEAVRAKKDYYYYYILYFNRLTCSAVEFNGWYPTRTCVYK
jgi:hypothetical protein